MAVLIPRGRAVNFDLDVGPTGHTDISGGEGPDLAGGKPETAREPNSAKRLSRGADYQAGREVGQVIDGQSVAGTSSIHCQAAARAGKISQFKRGTAESRQPVSSCPV